MDDGLKMLGVRARFTFDGLRTRKNRRRSLDLNDFFYTSVTDVFSVTRKLLGRNFVLKSIFFGFKDIVSCECYDVIFTKK